MTRTYQYDVEDARGVEQVLGGVFMEFEQAYKNADFTPLMQSFLNTLNVTHEGYFDRDVSPAGEAWRPLAALTIAKKGHATILEDTRKMKRSVTESGAPDAVRSATHRGLVFGTSDEKAIFHQYGTRKIPKREFVGMDEALLDQFVEQIADSVVEQLTI